MIFSSIPLEQACTLPPVELVDAVINGVPVNPANPPARDLSNERRTQQELMLWWRQPYLTWNPIANTWEIRCLDGGAHDRPTFNGSHPELAKAIEAASAPTRNYALHERYIIAASMAAMNIME